MRPATERAVASFDAHARLIGLRRGWFDPNRLEVLAECAEKNAAERNLDGLVHVAAHDVPELISEIVRLRGLK